MNEGMDMVRDCFVEGSRHMAARHRSSSKLLRPLLLLGLLVVAPSALADDPVCSDFIDDPLLPGTSVVVNEDESITVSVLNLCSDADGDTLRLRDTVRVADTTIASVTKSGDEVIFTPNANYNGITSFSFRVEDLPGLDRSNRATIQVTVLPVNDAPTLVSPIADVTLGEDTASIIVDVSSAFADADGDTLTFRLVGNSNAALITSAAMDAATGRLTLTFAPNMDGSDTIDVVASDDLFAEALDSFVVTITGTNDVPVANPDTVTVAEDTAAGIVIAVLANDELGDEPTTVTAGVAITLDTDDDIAEAHQFASNSSAYTFNDGLGGPVSKHRGFVDINGDGTITYTPNRNFSGADTVTYTIVDSDGESSTASVTITVTPVNDAPVIQGSSSLADSIAENTVLLLPAPGLLTSAFDADNELDELSIVLIDPADFAARIEVDADGRLLYQPAVDFVGTDTLRFQVSDGGAFSATYTFTITVTDDMRTDFGVSSGEVEFDFQLADIPLELSLGVDPNVLVVMDDSGSMDWTLATNEDQGRMNVVGFGGGLRAYAYLYTLPTNSYDAASGNGRVIPSNQVVEGAGGRLAGNTYGVWRAFNADYNPIYYNPRVRYRPWVGVGTNNVDFPNACPTRASLDAFQFPQVPAGCTGAATAGQEVDVAGNIPEYITGVPRMDRVGATNVTVTARPWAHYYRITDAAFVAGTRPAQGVAKELVEIVAADDTYDGGPDRTDCVASGSAPDVCTYAEEIQNFANWFTYYRSREYSTKYALGRVVAQSAGLRIGYGVINNVAADSLPIRLMNNNPATDNKRALLDQIYEVDSQNGTPLRSALDRAGRHFECVAGDTFGSTASTTPGDAACPVLAAPAGQCQQHFTLLFTDGAWNGDDGFATTNHDADAAAGSTDSVFDGGSFEDTIGGSLADVAMNYYERDLQSALSNEVQATVRDVAGVATGSVAAVFPGNLMHQHMSTYTIGFGLLGNITSAQVANIQANPATPFAAWGDPITNNIAKVDDLFHAAHNGRGAALSASDPTSLVNTISQAFEEFSQSIGAASAVSFDAARLNLGTTRFRGLFNVRDNSGELLAERLGNDGNYSVVWRASTLLDSVTPSTRVVVTYDPGARVGRDFTRTALAGITGILPAFTDATSGPDLVNYFRGDRSNERTGRNYRSRPATQGLLGDIVHSTPLFIGAPGFLGRDRDAYPTAEGQLYSEFKNARASRAGMVFTAANDGMLHGFEADTGQERFAFIPNKILNTDAFSNSLQDLASTAYAHTFFNDLSPESNDVFITTRGATTRAWRTVLVGGLGGGGKGYYAVDITDPANLDDTANAISSILWEFTDKDDTVAVRANGDPLVDEGGDPLEDGNGNPVKDLGYAYTEPQIQMTNAEHSSGQRKWAAVFGNGYNSTAGYATMFVVFIEAGIDGWGSGDVIKLRTDVGPPACPDTNGDGVRDVCDDDDVDGDVGFPNGLGSVRAVDEDGNGTVDLAYGGDQLGNLYRFDMRSSDPDEWRVVRIFQAKYDNGTPADTSDDQVQPITSRPIVLRNPQQPEGFIVLVGTGSYVTTPDATSTDIQSMYGIWDRGEENGFAPLVTDGRRYLVEQSYISFLGDDDDNAATPDRPLRRITSNCVEYGVGPLDTDAGCPTNPDASEVPFHRGWYIDLDGARASGDTAGNGSGPQFPGERAVRNIQLFGGFGFVNSVIPRGSNTCLDAPGGYALIFNPATGGTGSLRDEGALAFDRNNDGRFDALDRIGGDAISGSRFDGVPGDSTFIRSGSGATRVTQESTGDVDERNVPDSGGNRTGRLSWQELE